MFTRLLAVLAVTVVMALGINIVSLHSGDATPPEKKAADQKEVEKLCDDFVAYAEGKLPLSDGKCFHGRYDILPVLKQRFQKLGQEARVRLAWYVIMLWPVDTSQAYSPWAMSPELVDFWIWVIANDAEREVRDKASDCLARWGQDNCLRARTFDIIDLVKNGRADDECVLLGKTGSIEARRLLESEKAIRDESPEMAEAALAKLGNSELEMKFIKQFRNEKDLRKKKDLAATLGYIGTPACMITLAREIRNQQRVDIAGDPAFCNFIVQAMSVIEPENPLLWPHLNLHQDTADKWFAEIESWLKEKYGIEFQGKRDPFPLTKDMVD